MKIFSQIILLFILMCLYGHSFAQCNLSVSGTRTNVTCNGAADGSIQITISGEQGDITYLWNDGATTQNRSGLVPGIYTVTVTDDFVSNCNKKRTFQITEPDALEVNAIINNATTPGGNDGSINITVNGGTTPYSFLWSNSATTQNISSLSAGDYTVTVTDENDCVFTETYAVSDASRQIQVFPASPSICAGSGNGVQLIVTAFGATAYEWSPSTGLSATSGAAVVATPLVTQTYTVTASNLSDCAAIITVTVHPIPTVDLIPDAVYCNSAAATGINFTGTLAGAVFIGHPIRILDSALQVSVISIPMLQQIPATKQIPQP
ncbi:MAG: SprB repeat-containing protein [Chitinophagaceae bacterium]|nr:SprB repeat-containing protein [Chitinophagaceae bacterium]